MSMFIKKQEELGNTILKLIKLHSDIIEAYDQMKVFNDEDANLLTKFKNEHVVVLQELERLFKKYQTLFVAEETAKFKLGNCGTSVITTKRFNTEKKQRSLNLIEEELNRYCF